MEIVLVTKSRSIGIDEDASGLSDYDYFSLLPNYNNSFGIISSNSLNMLSTKRKNEVKNNVLDSFSITNKGIFLRKKEIFIVYTIKDIKPVLYEVLGYNCVINLKGDDYCILKSLQSFLSRDNSFNGKDFEALELNADYLICSYYEGEASFIYTVERFIPKIIDDFNRLCIKKCGLNVTVEELER